MRYPKADFRQLDLQVHSLLTTPRLMDVWAIPLENGGAGRTLQDFLDMAENTRARDVNPLVRGLFWVRHQLGRLFGWDGAATASQPAPASYVDRIPDELRAASLDEVGLIRGPVRILYRLENELLAEVINATVHAFISFSVFARDDGYVAYLGVYAIYTKWWTRYYLALIEPFRQFIVYPMLIKTVQKRWQQSMH